MTVITILSILPACEGYLRTGYQKLLVDGLAKQLAKYCSANQLTLVGLGLGVASALFLDLHHSLIAISLLLLSGYFDSLDGTVARIQNQSSSIGTVLDIVSDRIVEFAIVLGLFLLNPASRGLMAILMLGSILLCITSFLIVGVFSENEGQKGFYYSPGLMERAEAFIFFIAMILLPSFFTILALVFTGLVTFTVALQELAL